MKRCDHCKATCGDFRVRCPYCAGPVSKEGQGGFNPTLGDAVKAKTS